MAFRLVPDDLDVVECPCCGGLVSGHTEDFDGRWECSWCAASRSYQRSLERKREEQSEATGLTYPSVLDRSYEQIIADFWRVYHDCPEPQQEAKEKAKVKTSQMEMFKK